eukprot:c35358_g1_i1 orf=2-187(-)
MGVLSMHRAALLQERDWTTYLLLMGKVASQLGERSQRGVRFTRFGLSLAVCWANRFGRSTAP